MESSKITGIMDKLEGKAGIIGGALGFMNDIIVNAPEEWMNTMTYRISHWHIPDPMHTFQQMMANPKGYPIMSYAMGAVGAWILQEAGPAIDSRLGQVGRIVKKLSINALIGNIASGFIWLPAFNPGTGGGPTFGTATQTSPQNFNVGGPGAPHTTGANGYKQTLTFESVVAA